jgi:hypothetical protein
MQTSEWLNFMVSPPGRSGIIQGWMTMTFHFSYERHLLTRPQVVRPSEEFLGAAPDVIHQKL